MVFLPGLLFLKMNAYLKENIMEEFLCGSIIVVMEVGAILWIMWVAGFKL